MNEFLTLPFLDLVYFRTTLRKEHILDLLDYHMDRGVMPLHDAVGVNCEKGATTENRGAGVGYMG